MSMSEIRRSDRLGLTPQHVLFTAMKLIRLRIGDGIYNRFDSERTTENITRRMIEDAVFSLFTDNVIQIGNLSFVLFVKNVF